MIRLEDIRQDKDHTCGPAALAAVFRFWGLDPRGIGPLSNDVQGMAPDTVEAVLRRAGFNLFSGNLTVADLHQQTKMGRPVLCPISYEGGHWVVVSRVFRTRVYYQCPTLGPVHVPEAAWVAGWEDTTRFGHGFKSWGIVPWVRVN